MTGFWLIIGHLIGDYIVQNDWMAANKTAGPPGRPPRPEDSRGAGVPEAAHAMKMQRWEESGKAYRVAPWACTVHCLLYTLAVWACSFWWMPWWGLLVCFATHWPIDRFRLAGRWMRNVSGQATFAGGPLAPWSVVVVDNIAHLLTLGLIAEAAGQS